MGFFFFGLRMVVGGVVGGREATCVCKAQGRMYAWTGGKEEGVPVIYVKHGSMRVSRVSRVWFTSLPCFASPACIMDVPHSNLGTRGLGKREDADRGDGKMSV